MRQNGHRPAGTSPRAATITLAASALVALAALCAPAPAGAQMLEGPPAAGAPEAPSAAAQPIERDPEAVIARTDLGEIRVLDLMNYFRFWRNVGSGEVDWENLKSMPDEWVFAVATNYAISQELVRQADLETDPVKKTAYREAFNSYLLNYSIPTIYRIWVENQVVPATDEQVAEIYENEKPLYRIPFSFKMRRIYLMTYERYTTGEGDTLRSIAARINGDAGAIAGIRSDVDSRPLRWVAPEERASKLFRPLRAGEKLLVPMNAEAKAKVRARLEAILAERAEGKTFEELGEEYSEAETGGDVIGPLPAGLRPLVRPLREAAEATAVGEISPIFETRHGFEVIEIISKTEESFRPLASVSTAIRARILERDMKRLDIKLNDAMFANPRIHFYEDVVLRAPDIADDEVIFSIDEDQLTWATYKGFWGRNVGPRAPKEQALRMFRRFPPAKFLMTLAWCRDHKLFDSGELKIAHDVVRIGAIGKAVLEERVQEAEDAAVTEELIQARYEQDRDSLFTRPGLISFQIIERHPAGNFQSLGEWRKKRALRSIAKQLQGELRDRVHTLDDFIELARETNLEAGLSPGPTSAGSAMLSARDLDIRLITGRTAEMLAGLEVGEWSEPYAELEAIRAVGLLDRKAGQVQALEEVREDVENRVRAERRDEISHEIQVAILNSINFEFYPASAE